VQGIKKSYEVSAVTGVNAEGYNLAMKTLPCPCRYCFTGDEAHAPCANVLIVGAVTYDCMKEIEAAECPVNLFEPLKTEYTVEKLKLFIKSHELSLKGLSNKTLLVNFIRKELSDYIMVH
jgi:hypothetical protein